MKCKKYTYLYNQPEKLLCQLLGTRLSSEVKQKGTETVQQSLHLTPQPYEAVHWSHPHYQPYAASLPHHCGFYHSHKWVQYLTESCHANRVHITHGGTVNDNVPHLWAGYILRLSWLLQITECISHWAFHLWTGRRQLVHDNTLYRVCWWNSVVWTWWQY